MSKTKKLYPKLGMAIWLYLCNLIYIQLVILFNSLCLELYDLYVTLLNIFLRNLVDIIWKTIL